VTIRPAAVQIACRRCSRSKRKRGSAVCNFCTDRFRCAILYYSFTYDSSPIARRRYQRRST